MSAENRNAPRRHARPARESQQVESSRGDAAQFGLGVLVILAVLATVVMLVSGNQDALKLSLVAALWAAMLGAFLVTRYRRLAERRLADLQHERRLARAEAERQASERSADRARAELKLRRELEQEYRQRQEQDAETLAAIRAEVERLRATLAAMSENSNRGLDAAALSDIFRPREIERPGAASRTAASSGMAADEHSGRYADYRDAMRGSYAAEAPGSRSVTGMDNAGQAGSARAGSFGSDESRGGSFAVSDSASGSFAMSDSASGSFAMSDPTSGSFAASKSTSGSFATGNSGAGFAAQGEAAAGSAVTDEAATSAFAGSASSRGADASAGAAEATNSMADSVAGDPFVAEAVVAEPVLAETVPAEPVVEPEEPVVEEESVVDSVVVGKHSADGDAAPSRRPRPTRDGEQRRRAWQATSGRDRQAREASGENALRRSWEPPRRSRTQGFDATSYINSDENPYASRYTRREKPIEETRSFSTPVPDEPRGAHAAHDEEAAAQSPRRHRRRAEDEAPAASRHRAAAHEKSDGRESLGVREGRDGREGRDPVSVREGRNPVSVREGRDSVSAREGLDWREGRDSVSAREGRGGRRRRDENANAVSVSELKQRRTQP